MHNLSRGLKHKAVVDAITVSTAIRPRASHHETNATLERTFYERRRYPWAIRSEYVPFAAEILREVGAKCAAQRPRLASGASDLVTA
jgi:hypothetical protein